MKLRNHETQLNIWLFAQSVCYLLVGFGFYVNSGNLPGNFMLGYVPTVVCAIALCLYAVRVDSKESRKRSYAGLMRYQVSMLPFLIEAFLVVICCAAEEVLHFGGALAGFFAFLFVREAQMAVTNKIIRTFPADYHEE